MSKRPTLTPRQEDTLYLVIKGFTTPEIAIELGITPRTAKAHVTDLRRKFGCTRKAQLIRAGSGAMGETTRKAVYQRLRAAKIERGETT